MLRKPNDVIVTIEVKAKRHETPIAADTMALKKRAVLDFLQFLDPGTFDRCITGVFQQTTAPLLRATLHRPLPSGMSPQK